MKLFIENFLIQCFNNKRRIEIEVILTMDVLVMLFAYEFMIQTVQCTNRTDITSLLVLVMLQLTEQEEVTKKCTEKEEIFKFKLQSNFNISKFF